MITEPDVIDAILHHLETTGMRDPFERRPAASGLKTAPPGGITHSA